jgi:hypothetical protein
LHYNRFKAYSIGTLKSPIYLSFCVAFAVQISGGTLQAQSPYRLILVAKGGQTVGGNTLTGFFSSAVLSNNGNMAFVANDSSAAGEAIYTLTGTAVHLNDTIGGIQLQGGLGLGTIDHKRQ